MFFILSEIYQYILLAAGLIVFAWFVWRRMDWGIYLTVFLLPLYLLKIIVNGLPLTILELLILILLAVWLIKKLKEGFSVSFLKDLGWWNFGAPVIFLLAGATIATLFSADLRVSIGILKSWFIEPIIFGLIAFDVLQGRLQIKKALLALVYSGTAVTIISLGYLILGKLTFDNRLSAFYLSPNHLAMYLAPAGLAVFGLWYLAKKQQERWLLVIICCLLILALYFTYSYAAWLAVALAMMFLLIGFWRCKIISRRNFYIISCILALVFVMAVILQLDSDKLPDLFSSDRSSWQSRLTVWRAAIEIGKDNWFFGIGPGMFQKYYLDYQKFFLPYLEWAVPQPHNIFLAFWLQTGLLGLIGFVWLVINFFKNTVKSLGQIKEPLILILAVLMVYILAHGLVDTTYWKNDLALVFWIVIFLGYTVIRLRD